MKPNKHTPAGHATTELIVDVFRLNGRLLVAGDRLVAGLGLTSARWQVMGAIVRAPSAQPVAWLARSMGLNRQGVQRIVNEMVQEGLVELLPNPHHRRAHLVSLTSNGRAAYDAVEQLQIPWVNALAKGLDRDDIAAAARVLTALRERLKTDP